MKICIIMLFYTIGCGLTNELIKEYIKNHRGTLFEPFWFFIIVLYPIALPFLMCYFIGAELGKSILWIIIFLRTQRTNNYDK